jgi:hypothetical protein
MNACMVRYSNVSLSIYATEVFAITILNYKEI